MWFWYPGLEVFCLPTQCCGVRMFWVLVYLSAGLAQVSGGDRSRSLEGLEETNRGGKLLFLTQWPPGGGKCHLKKEFVHPEWELPGHKPCETTPFAQHSLHSCVTVCMPTPSLLLTHPAENGMVLREPSKGQDEKAGFWAMECGSAAVGMWLQAVLLVLPLGFVQRTPGAAAGWPTLSVS